mmetsp:Transcript_21074/g.34763  ORF Transcript_21074/g.34763 Transcript_21074/m.34763 type:complete len:297 (+) Transcript_21074:692-1582(+)
MGETTLHSGLGKTIHWKVPTIMRIELPALVDQIIIICSRVTNKVSILVGGVIHAAGAVQVTRIHLIEEFHGVFLCIIPPLFKLSISLIILLILTSQIQTSPLEVVIIGSCGLFVGIDALIIRVGTHHYLSTFQGHGSEVDFVAACIVVGALAIFIGHVGKSGEGNDVFIVINSPQVLRNLFIPLVMLLRINPQHQPTRIRLMTIQTPHRVIPIILLILSPRIIRIHIGSPSSPSFTFLFTISSVIRSTSIIKHTRTINKVPKVTIGLCPLFIITTTIGHTTVGFIGVTIGRSTKSP